MTEAVLSPSHPRPPLRQPQRRNLVNDKNYPISVSYNIGNQKGTLHLRPKLPFVEYGAAVESVVRSLYIDGAYKPYLKQYLICSVIIENYTDYSGGSSPDEILNLCEGSGFFTEIVSRIDPKQLENLLQDIDELAAYNNACAGWSNIIREIKKISAELQKGGCKPDKGG